MSQFVANTAARLMAESCRFSLDKDGTSSSEPFEVYWGKRAEWAIDVAELLEKKLETRGHLFK
jgi:hypothetical protein